MILSALRKIVPDRHPIRLGWHFAKAFLAACIYGFPARKLTVIGITGTDGKTTTVGMVSHILEKEGIKAGTLSTTYFKVHDQTEWNETQKTSPSPFEVQKFLRRLVRVGCTHAILEYSSHGLVQGRTHYTWPQVAAITNTSMEHLDYHGSMEQYREDKGKLFGMLRGKGTKVLNRLDETYDLYQKIPSERTITYAFPEGDLFDLPLKIPGSFNKENALCAMASSEAVGVSRKSSLQALKSFEGVPGRMERLDEGQPFLVFVDMTVTPAAYTKTLKALREIIGTQKRVLVLTGSCGDRMKEKRPIVGQICSELADIVVVTNEDPYTEDPEKIIEEVWAGIDQKKTEAHKIFDRKEAMEFLFQKAQPGDGVILCAKGSDTTMWVKNGQIPWNEREIARELLKILQKKHPDTKKMPPKVREPEAAKVG